MRMLRSNALRGFTKKAQSADLHRAKRQLGVFAGKKMGLERFELSIDGSLRSVLQRDIT